MKLLLSLLLLTVPLVSLASDKGNGGDSVTMPNGRRVLLDLVEQGEFDYFEFDADVFDDAKKGAIGMAIEQPGHHGTLPLPPFQSALVRCLGTYAKGNEIFPVRPLRWAMTDAELPEIADEGAISIPSSISKKQLAVQTDGLVLVNRADFASLDDVSKIALKLHEGAICAIRAVNPYLLPISGTKPIRDYVRAFIGWYMGGTPRYVLNDSIKALNTPPVAADHVAVEISSSIRLLVPYILRSRQIIVTDYVSTGIYRVVDVDTLKVIGSDGHGSKSLAIKLVKENQTLLKSKLEQFTLSGVRSRQARGENVTSDMVTSDRK